MEQINKKPLSQAIPFIMINERKTEDGKIKTEFELHSKAADIFKTIKGKKVAIATVAGPQRSGKSFLSNRLLKRMKGFAVGPSTMPCTKGLWIWGQPIPINEDTVLIIMDTEGLNSVQRDINVDLKIFSLSILLSSVFIYNSLGHIDEKAIQNMSYVLRISQNLRIQTSNQSDGEISKCFPYFYWILRDFSLDLKGMTENQYLENALKPTSKDEKDPKNEIRSKIRKLFAQRSCECFPRPLNEEDKLAHIQQQNFESLRQVFKQKMNQFVVKFYQTLPVKQYNGKQMTSEIYLNLVRQYLNAINTGKVPQVLTSLERVIESEAKQITEGLATNYRSQMKNIFNDEPIDEIILQKNHLLFMKSIEDNIEKKLKGWLDFGQAGGYKTKLVQNLDKQFKDIKKRNNQLCTQQCSRQFSIFINEVLVLPTIKNPDIVHEGYFKQKLNDLIAKIQPFYKKCKQPRKYIYFMEKFPKAIFDYFQTFLARAKGAFNTHISQIKAQSQNFEQRMKSMERILSQQQNLLNQKQKQIQAATDKVQDLRRQLQKNRQMRQFQSQTENMGKTQLRKNLQHYKQQCLELQNANEQLSIQLQKKKNEIAALKLQLSQKEQFVSPQQSTQASSDTPCEVINLLESFKQKLTNMKEIYDNNVKEESMQQGMLRQIEQLKTEKQIQIEKAKEKFNHKLTEMRNKHNKQRAEYERNMDMLNHHLDDIKTRNIELEKLVNDRKNTNLAVDRKNLEETIRLKQNNINSLKALSVQKDSKIKDLQLRLAKINSEMANLLSYKQTFPYILGQSLSWIQGKGNKLKHSLKTLDTDDQLRIKRVFKELNLNPF